MKTNWTKLETRLRANTSVKEFWRGNKLLTIVNLAALILLRFKLQEMQLTFWNFPSQQRYPPCCKLQRAGKCKHNLVTLRSWKNYKYLSPYSPFLKRIILRELLFCTTWIGNGTKCKSHVQVKIVLLIKRTAFCVFSVHKFYNPQIKIKVVSQKLVVSLLSLNKILQNHLRKDEETRKKIVLVTRHEF